MKFLFTCALLAILAFTTWADEATLARYREDNINCQIETGTDDMELAKYYQSGQNPADASDAVKCHMKCIMEKDGMFKNGKFDEEGFAESVKGFHSRGIKKVGICKLEKGANECETAFKIAACFMKYDKMAI